MRTYFCISAALILAASCKPKPIDIKVDQHHKELAIASVALDVHTVYVSAGYSVSSLSNLTDTARNEGRTGISKDLLVDSGLVMISRPGVPADTLEQYAPGLFGSRKITLTPDAVYTLSVADYRTGSTVTARTTFSQLPLPDTLMPVVTRRASDTVVRLKVQLSQVKASDRYFIYYAAPSSFRQGLSPWTMSISALQSFSPKKICLLSGADAQNGHLNSTFVLDAKGRDTLYVQLARADEAYYNFLSAYKRSGNLLSQYTGEPINLPSNLSRGYGFFSLYLPERRMFLLKDY